MAILNDSVKLEDFKEFFVGSIDNVGKQYKTKDDEVKWVSGKIIDIFNQNTTIDQLLQKHLNQQITIGTYPYYRINGDPMWFCQYIMIDIDDHDSKDKLSVVKSLNPISKELKQKLIDRYGIPENCILRDFSGRGYHLWIKLEKLTPLSRAWDFKIDIENFLKEDFNLDIEVFPKQSTMETGSYGNCCKLPLSINCNNDEFSNILDGFDLSKQGYGCKIVYWIEEAEKVKKPKKIKKEVDKKQGINDVLLKLRKEYRDILTGKIEIESYCIEVWGKPENKLKELVYWKSLISEVEAHGLTIEDVKDDLIANQPHFDYEKTLQQLKSPSHQKRIRLTKNSKNYFPDYYQEKNKGVYNSYEISDSILETYTIQTLGRKRPDYCLYKKGVYERGQLTTIETIISNTLRDLEIPYSLSKNSELLKLIANGTYIDIDKFDKNPYVLNLKNGLFDIKTLELKPHTPEYLSFRRIPINYDPKAKCPKIRKFLKEIFNSEDVRYILEKVGLSLTPIMNLQDGTFLFGTGNNGKTTFYNLLRKLLGTNNYSGVDLIKLDGFIFSQIENKLANIVSDIDSSQEINIQNYKIYVGNELVVYINRKFIEPYEVPPTAKMWYSCNSSFPQVPFDTDKGFWRKITIIECPFELDNIEDPNILEELTTPEELSGFLNLAIKNLRTLLRRKRFFPRYTNWELYKDFWLTKNNLFGQFVEETMLIGSQYYSDKQETLKNMNNWLTDKGKPPISDKKLTSMIKGVPKYYHERLSINSKQIWLYTGFSIPDDVKEIPKYYLKKRKKLKPKIINDFNETSGDS